jgi:hypothetical protein
MKKVKRLDVHVSFTLSIPEKSAAAVAAAVRVTLPGLFPDKYGIRLRNVEVGEPHDPKAR